MKQYKITSTDFVPQGETGEPNAFMDPADLARIKQLAGINSLVETTLNIQQDTDEPLSPIGAVNNNLSQKRQIEKSLNIKVGTPEWFRLYFARPSLTGEKPVGDEMPESEPNPRYLLDKDGLPDSGKVSDLADKLNQAATDCKPKY